jgi:hypothetical protein
VRVGLVVVGVVVLLQVVTLVVMNVGGHSPGEGTGDRVDLRSP